MASEATRNLTVERAPRNVWEESGSSSVLANCDVERWAAAGAGSVMAIAGARRGGAMGAILAGLGVVIATRAAMGWHDVTSTRRAVDSALVRRGSRHADIVEESSDESFPASDSPSWTSSTGASAR